MLEPGLAPVWEPAWVPGLVPEPGPALARELATVRARATRLEREPARVRTTKMNHRQTI